MPIVIGALLCDAAHEYSGLVSILGGFVNVTRVPRLPVPAPIWCAARVGFDREESERSHDVLVKAENPGGNVRMRERGVTEDLEQMALTSVMLWTRPGAPPPRKPGPVAERIDLVCA